MMIPEVNDIPQSLPFHGQTRIRIGRLSPESDSSSASFIEGDVALVWPFSSATESLSILLADFDVRLRKSKGQVKVTFQDACAREVARSKVGIGDKVRLSLEGVEWVHTGDFISTPGKKIEWDLCFRKRAMLEISLGSTALVLVDFEQPKEAANGLNGAARDPSTPSTRRTGDMNLPTQTFHYSSPAFSLHKRQSGGSFIDASLDPFAEDDGFVVGKGRKRTKFARHSGTWTLLGDDNLEQSDTTVVSDGEEREPVRGLDNSAGSKIGAISVSDDADKQDQLLAEANGHTESGEESVSEEDLMDADDSPKPGLHDISSPEEVSVLTDEIQTSKVRLTSPTPMAPPKTNSRPPPIALPDSPEAYRAKSPDPSESQATTTPRLHPLPSPGLPLVSPLIQRHGRMTGYFPEYRDADAELDATATPVQTEQLSSALHETADFPLTMPATSPGIQANTAVDPAQACPPSREIRGHDHDSIQPSLEAVHSSSRDRSQPPRGISSNSTMIVPDEDQVQQLPNAADIATNDWTHSFPEASLETNMFQTEPEVIEDEDMYGSVKLPDVTDLDHFASFDSMLNTETSVEEQGNFANVYEPSPADETQQARSWQEKLAISAVDAETGQAMSSPPFSFVQSWENSLQRSKRSSTHPHSFDGASDQMDQNEIPLRSSEFPEPESVGELEVVIEEQEIISLSSGEDRVMKLDKAVLEEVTVSVLDEVEPFPLFKSSAGIEEADLLIDRIDVEYREAARSVQLVEPELDQKPSAEINQDLPTPANTQQELLRDKDITTEAPLQEQAMPPTPENTQEKVESHLPRLPLEPVSEDVENTPVMASAIKPTSHSFLNTRRTSQRLSRKSLPLENISELSSPYFKPRRSDRMTTRLLSSSTRKENIPPRDSNSFQAEPRAVGKSEPKSPPESFKEITESTPIPSLVSRSSGLTTSLSYFTPLASVSDHFFQNVDVLAVCSTGSTEPQRAKSGPKDFHSTLQLVDSSLEVNNIVISQIFRPSKFALPAARRGDVVLLRSFKVQSQKRKCMLLSTDISAWAVFSHPENKYSSTSMLGVRNAGPPVEYGPEERSRAIELMQWWDEDGIKRFPLPAEPDIAALGPLSDIDSVSGLPATEPPPSRKSNRRYTNITDHIGNDGEDDHPILPVILLPPSSRRRSDASVMSLRTHRTQRDTRRSRRSESVIHELRDGTKWVDIEGESLVHELRDGVTWVDD